MKIPDLDELINKFQDAGLTHLEIRNGDEEVILKKELPVEISTPSSNTSSQSVASQESTSTNKNITIDAPFVGTFYTSPSPQEEPFVKVGDQVKKGQVVGIIEAMKMMTEVKADTSGTVTDILVANENPVEYGEALIAIKK